MSERSADTGAEVLVEASGLTRWYGERCAVRDLDLRLHRGEVLGLLGANGAGKSTTLQMLAGVLAPHAGGVAIAGADLLEAPREARRRLGYLPEQPPLTRELTVDEYLDFCGRLRGLRGAALAAAREAAKARCGLADTGRRLIANLSKGYQQRTGIAQAILHRPAVVILDEPTVGLDPIQIREIRALVRELGRDHGVILSTHILPEVQSACDRVAIIHAGRIVLDARTADVGAAAGASLRLRLRRPPPLAEIGALPGVMAVSELADGRLLVAGGGEELAERIAAHAAGAGWGLTELVAQGATLEEVFVRLTGGEAEAAA